MITLCQVYLNYYSQNSDTWVTKNVNPFRCNVRNLYDCSIKPEGARDKCPPEIRDPNNTNFKIRGMVLIRIDTPMDTFDLKYKPCFRICKKISDKAFDVQDSAG